MPIWYNKQMPSKNMLMRLARKPFAPPPKNTLALRDEVLWELDSRRQTVAMNSADEEHYWYQEACTFLELAQTHEAKKYIWSEFSQALPAMAEPELFMGNCRWLLDHREWAPRNAPALAWFKCDDFSVESLLATSSQLPHPTYLEHLQAWLHAQQKELSSEEGKPRMLPVQKIRSNSDEDGLYDEDVLSYRNTVLWPNVVLPLLEHKPQNDPFTVPYLPFHGDHSFTEQLLNNTPQTMHPWILQNAVFAGDITPIRTSSIEEGNVMHVLAKWTTALPESPEKSFMAWDLLHRREHDSIGADIVKSYCPDVHAMLETLGLLQLPAIREAVLKEWHTPQNNPNTSLPLPDELLTDMDLTST